MPSWVETLINCAAWYSVASLRGDLATRLWRAGARWAASL